MESIEMKCSSCRFFCDMEGYLRTVCVRFPPTLTMGDNGELQNAFPDPAGSWWCGEWRSKEKEQGWMLQKKILMC